jgi:hypothetical protein
MLKYLSPSRQEGNRKRSLVWFACGVGLLVAVAGLAVAARFVSIPDWFMAIAGLIGAPAGVLFICYAVTIRFYS